MAESENKTPVSARENLLSRARERYPDRTFADLGATEPQEGVSDLDDAINEMLEDYASRQATYDENNGRLRDLLVSDPSSAEFIQKWIETGDPRTALVEVFGDELGISEEGQAQFKDQLDGWRERKAANDALEAEAEGNWQNSLQALEEWGNAKGLSLEEKRDVMLRLLAITFNGMENKYGAEDFDLAYNAIHHDTDVAAARQEGEVAGRNAKIAAARRDRNAAAAMPPAPAGRQGGVVAEPKPERPASPWAGVK
jgi:hypothetical protein